MGDFLMTNLGEKLVPGMRYNVDDRFTPITAARHIKVIALVPLPAGHKFHRMIDAAGNDIWCVEIDGAMTTTNKEIRLDTLPDGKGGSKVWHEGNLVDAELRLAELEAQVAAMQGSINALENP